MKNIRNFYQLVKQHRRGIQPKTVMIRDDNGVLLTANKYIKERWVEYFMELLNVEHEEPLKLYPILLK